MNEFIEKLIGRLEEQKSKYQYLADSSNFDGWAQEEKKYLAKEEMCEEIIEIVNQLAEEYKLKTNANMQEVIDNLEVYTVGRLNTSKVDISVLQLQRYINRLKQIAEEYNNGWINADVESPTENGKYIVYYRKWTDGNYLPKFDETEIRILRYRNNDWVFPTYGDTEAEKDIHREVLAWQPLPAPYQPKGE